MSACLFNGPFYGFFFVLFIFFVLSLVNRFRIPLDGVDIFRKKGEELYKESVMPKHDWTIHVIQINHP